MGTGGTVRGGRGSQIGKGEQQPGHKSEPFRNSMNFLAVVRPQTWPLKKKANIFVRLNKKKNTTVSKHLINISKHCLSKCDVGFNIPAAKRSIHMWFKCDSSWSLHGAGHLRKVLGVMCVNEQRGRRRVWSLIPVMGSHMQHSPECEVTDPLSLSYTHTRTHTHKVKEHEKKDVGKMTQPGRNGESNCVTKHPTVLIKHTYSNEEDRISYLAGMNELQIAALASRVRAVCGLIGCAQANHGHMTTAWPVCHAKCQKAEVGQMAASLYPLHFHRPPHPPIPSVICHSSVCANSVTSSQIRPDLSRDCDLQATSVN